MYTEGCTLYRGFLVKADDTFAQEMGRQVMAPYFCAGARGFDTCQM